MSYRVLIADDNFYVRRGLRDLFNHQSEFMICGESENGKEAVQKAQELHPDLIVLDLSMPVMNGLAARILKQGDRVALPGRGAAVVERVDGKEAVVILGNRLVSKIPATTLS